MNDEGEMTNDLLRVQTSLAGEQILTQGAPSSVFYIVASGRV